MGESNWNKIGNELREAVEDSLNTGDFQQLGQVLTGTVSSALSEAKRQIGQQFGQEQSGNGQSKAVQGQGYYQPRTDQGQTGNGQGQNVQNQTRYQQPSYNTNQSYPNSSTRYNNGRYLSRVKMNKIGSVSSVLLMVFGGIGTGIMGIILLFMVTALGTGFLSAILPSMGIILALMAMFIFMIQVGCSQKDRLKRAKRYVELCGNSHYINIDDLAIQTGKSKRYVLRDVKKMLRTGFFPEGHLDQEETCLMLDDTTYRQYLAIQKERKARELEERVARMQAKKDGKQVEEPFPGMSENAAQSMQREGRREEKESEPMDPELAALVKEGQDCIHRLRDLNDNIEGEVISAKLFQLENLLKEIFARVKEHPEQMPQMKKFMNYYLPTTIKLVEAYEEFDNVSVPGEDIVQAKEEIEKTLDTINMAFAELLNRLFRESVFDVTTDAQVLQTMLAQEGLMREKEFEKVPR